MCHVAHEACMLARIAITWLVTLPVTIVLAGTLFYVLA
jgi:phosphate/sulfate permease